MQKIIQLKNNDNILQQQQINNPNVPLVTNSLIQNSTQSVTSNQDNQDQIFDIQKQNADLRIIGNYGSKKILSDINQVEMNFETEIGIYNLKNKKLKLIQKNLTKHYNYIAQQEDQLSQQVKRDIYFHLFQKNQKYQEILQKHYLEIKEVEKEKIDKEFQKSLKIIEQRRMEKINKQNKPKKGGNRENPQDQEYLEKTLIPLLKQQFKSIFSKFIEDQYGLYEPSFPIFEQFISFEELRTVLYNWDNLTQRLRYARDH
ncbi:hypothetical protein PPERSA_02950 [Pseudocohnilembus persalinus]|uniref:Uncharacterized protein n=1 Tax=Pseudocohnilembus persalinus TaxID=266149 RepID=A0A0V0QA73_PSEPJ|nr:hypothetical protein PPERSA_02950 [Pseudocohnilembus persalinus]|eukprot:KRW99118.1 hypothetical protein PPERSA_02950 [Pseudocohnilembus persalinus]